MSHTLHCAQFSACLGPNLDSKVHFGGCKPEQKGVNVYPKLGGANGEKNIFNGLPSFSIPGYKVCVSECIAGEQTAAHLQVGTDEV